MTPTPDFQLIKTNWQKSQDELRRIRESVFIDEQQVPEELEWDEYDRDALHILAINKDNKAIATGRIKPDGQIGRMAVLKEYRNRGIGSAILKELLTYAKQNNYPNIYLHAQTSALDFYKKHGFKGYGDIFMDAGIPHQSMKLT